MSVDIFQEKKCGVCNQIISFEDYCRDNPSISSQRAQDFWEDSLFLIFCPDCFFNLSERPFKQKRGYLNYYSRIKR
ncbi:MAG: hypothetical protein HWN81_16945 [Candidatus Lokiarchaeota archaeon]|nr:hypothetical protein [Candidatus Lokiarchaeota archaeon]